MEKITIAQKFDNAMALVNTLPESAERDEVLAFLADRKEKSQKKSNGEPKGKSKEYLDCKELVKKVLTDTPQTVTALSKSSPEFAKFTNQRVTAVLKELCSEGVAIRTESKGAGVYALAPIEVGEEE